MEGRSGDGVGSDGTCIIASPCRLVHKPLAEMTDQERAGWRFYAPSWRDDDRRVQDKLRFRLSKSWQQTVAETLDTAGS